MDLACICDVSREVANVRGVYLWSNVPPSINYAIWSGKQDMYCPCYSDDLQNGIYHHIGKHVYTQWTSAPGEAEKRTAAQTVELGSAGPTPSPHPTWPAERRWGLHEGGKNKYTTEKGRLWIALQMNNTRNGDCMALECLWEVSTPPSLQPANQLRELSFLYLFLPKAWHYNWL